MSVCLSDPRVTGTQIRNMQTRRKLSLQRVAIRFFLLIKRYTTAPEVVAVAVVEAKRSKSRLKNILKYIVYTYT